MKYDKFVHGKIDEFKQWYDIDGNIINASDGGVIFADGKYWWYGMKLQPLPVGKGGIGGQVTRVGVVMYSSIDLYNWKYEGVILNTSNDPNNELFAPVRFERPKIVYNAQTKKFVLWCHFVKSPGDHGFTPGTAEAGVAVCDTVNGTYEWLGTTRPVCENSLVRDFSMYKDKDGAAYIIFDRELLQEGATSFSYDTNPVKADRCIYVVKLSDDYLSCSNEYIRVEAGFWREAAAIVEQNGYYFMFTSGLTGWRTNPALYLRSKSLLGEWEIVGDPCVNDVTRTTFETQSTFIFPVHGKEGQFIIMLERHNTQNFEECSYIWLPIMFPTKDTMAVAYHEEWSLADYFTIK